MATTHTIEEISEAVINHIEKQIEVFDDNNVIYQSITMNVNYDDKKGKLSKDLVFKPDRYTILKVDTRNFNEKKHNCVAIMLGINYNGLILIDIDNVGDTVKIFDKNI